MVARGVALILLVCLSVFVAPTHATTEECPPPCLWIYPTIGLEVDLPERFRQTSHLDDLPETVDVHVSYHWDLEEQGTGVPGPNPAEIHLAVLKLPYWLEAELSSDTCPFQPVPHRPDQEVCTVQLHLTLLGTPQSEAALEDGDRLILMAMSDESGTYKPAYGVHDTRFVWDGSIAAAPVPRAEEDHDATLAWSVPFALAALALAALGGLVRRRRRP